MTNDTIKLETSIRELSEQVGRCWEAWLATQPADDLRILEGEIDGGARPGIRFIVGDGKKMSQVTFLMETRSGDVETVGVVELTRG